MPKRAVLLVNLGSPDSTSVPDVRRYLDEFLGDERVIDRPMQPFRSMIFNGIVIPRRAPQSAHAYQQIWTNDGSPLGPRETFAGGSAPRYVNTGHRSL